VAGRGTIRGVAWHVTLRQALPLLWRIRNISLLLPAPTRLQPGHSAPPPPRAAHSFSSSGQPEGLLMVHQRTRTNTLATSSSLVLHSFTSPAQRKLMRGIK
jgi:hypothetical protein